VHAERRQHRFAGVGHVSGYLVQDGPDPVRQESASSYTRLKLHGFAEVFAIDRPVVRASRSKQYLLAIVRPRGIGVAPNRGSSTGSRYVPGCVIAAPMS
jgi:hypothetical protein